MEIYGSRRAEQTPFSPPVCETPANGPLHPLEGLRYILLHWSPIGCACAISSCKPGQGDLVRDESAWSCPNFKSASDGYNAVRRRKHLPGLILPNRNSRKSSVLMLARVQAQLENAPPQEAHPGPDSDNGPPTSPKSPSR